jgi:hypothetical protein
MSYFSFVGGHRIPAPEAVQTPFSEAGIRYARRMGVTGKVLVATAAAAAGVIAVRKTAKPASTVRRRHAITVYRPIDEIERDGKLPSPLAELSDGIDIEMRPAPGDRGTEIYARSKGTISERAVRRALRDTRSLIEAGDVLLPYGPPTTEPTVANRGLRAVTRRGREGGLL